MDMPFDNLKALASQISESQSQVTQKILDLESNLNESLGGLISVWGRSVDQQIEMIAEDEWRYGYLTYSNGELSIASRTTYDDMEDVMHNIPDEYRTYQLKKLREAQYPWHLVFSDKKVITSLLKSIEDNLLMMSEDANNATSSLDEILHSESSSIDNDVNNALKGNEPLLKDWIKARASIFIDPADSITRSSSYLESVCKYVIESNNSELPINMDITNLIKTAINCIDMDISTEANSDIRQIIGGVKSIFSGVGATRTHVGTAHGSSPGDLPATETLAQLVNNSAAAASIYILSAYKEKPNKLLKNDAESGAS